MVRPPPRDRGFDIERFREPPREPCPVCGLLLPPIGFVHTPEVCRNAKRDQEEAERVYVDEGPRWFGGEDITW